MFDCVFNGQAHGNVATTLMANNFDVGALRPYPSKCGRFNLVTVNRLDPLKNSYSRQPVITNTPATLRKDDWKMIDDAVMRVAKPRLRFVGDLRSRGLQMVLPNGMSRIAMEYEVMSDITPATISMSGLRQSENDRPTFDLRGLPLPIIHKDIQFDARQVMVSRQGGTPLDTTAVELAARRVAEEAEKLALGVSSTYSYAGYTVYGLINHPNRNTYTLSDPTDPGWVPADTLADVLAMKAASQADNMYGPWMLYCATAWDEYMDNDFSDAKGDLTLRERLMKIDGIQGVQTLDYLTGYRLVLVQMTSDVIREVIGMDITTVQWETQGGFQLNFKVLAIMVPQLRVDAANNSGIVDGNVA